MASLDSNHDTTKSRIDVLCGEITQREEGELAPEIDTADILYPQVIAQQSYRFQQCIKDLKMYTIPDRRA
jgi:hypothetical protein